MASQLLPYRRPPADAHPPNDVPAYRSTALRHPAQPLVVIPQTLSELTGPAHGHGAVGPQDADLTRQHPGEPQGERIVVDGSPTSRRTATTRSWKRWRRIAERRSSPRTGVTGATRTRSRSREPTKRCFSMCDTA